jgi:hypothetical protein
MQGRFAQWRWSIRVLGGKNMSLILSDIELGKTCGMSVAETGSCLGNYNAHQWLEARMAEVSPYCFVGNICGSQGKSVDISNFTDTWVVMRYYLTPVDQFGPGKRYRCVMLDELNRVYDHISRRIAD